jgi:hypothetical protein
VTVAMLCSCKSVCNLKSYVLSYTNVFVNDFKYDVEVVFRFNGTLFQFLHFHN